tara:strand:- start:13261 stop:13449 length:189 start_codon:yes stop_codon:yes gene_type:complete
MKKISADFEQKNIKKKAQQFAEPFVVRLGLEPRLFWTKTRRVASYTIGQWVGKSNNSSIHTK